MARQAPGEPATRERIVTATAGLLQRKGYPGSGLKEISADAAAPFGSLYHFFPGGKVELAAEALRWSGEGYRLLVLAVFDAAPDLVTGVGDAFAGAGATLVASDYADACPIATVALEVASTNDELRRVVHEVFETWLASATELIGAAGVAPERARQLAILFVAALEGGFVLSRTARSTEAMDAIGALMTELVRNELRTA